MKNTLFTCLGMARNGLLAGLLLLLAAPAMALEYRSIAAPAVLYDGPSKKATPLFVIARQTPVEVVVTVAGWSKVRDLAGGLAWVEQAVLDSQRTVQVTAALAQVRSAADEASALVFEAERDVLLELLEAQAVDGWAKVRHRDGQIGFVRVGQIWGM